MAWPDIAVLDESLNGSLNVIAGDGTAMDADSLPTYTIYEDGTNTAILSGSYTKLDDDNTTGYYQIEIDVTAANGFERFKSYHVLSKATVSGVDVQTTDSFIVFGASDTFSATSGALTTVANFQAYSGVSGNDSLITALINRATSAIQRYCDRDFISATYREIIDGESDVIVLEHYPVISIQMFSVGRQAGLTITNTSSDAYNAYVQVDDTTMTLVVQGGSNAGSNSLTLDDYASITALRAAIDALGSGWSTTAVSDDAELWDPIELLPTSGVNVLNVKIDLDLPDTPNSDYLIDYDTGIITNNCYGIDSYHAGYEDNHYYSYYGIQNIIVRYTAGYATTPADLEQICLDLTKAYYDARTQSAAVESERIGDYSYKLLTGGALTMPEGIRNRLETWRRRTL